MDWHILVAPGVGFSLLSSRGSYIWEVLNQSKSSIDNFFKKRDFCFVPKDHFPLGGIFREERHFVLFEDQLAESGRQKTKENITPCGQFRLVENGP